MKKRITIETPNGEGLIEDMFISELGFLMVSVYYTKNKTLINHNLGQHNPANNFFTSSITKDNEHSY